MRITLLGPAGVDAPGPVPPGQAGLLTEVLVYLAAHPGGVPRSALSAAIWPGGVSPADCDAALDRASAWLGADSIGRPHLAADPAGRLRFGSGVRVDWQVFQALAGHAALAPAGSAPEAGYLARALEQVSGPFLDGRDPARYAWLATEGLEYEAGARVADAAHRLSALRRDAGDAEGAMAAARAGLRLASGDELLWRDLLRGAEATGQPDVLHAVVEEVCDWAALDEAEPRMAPETEASSMSCTRPGARPSASAFSGSGQPGVDAGQQTRARSGGATEPRTDIRASSARAASGSPCTPRAISFWAASRDPNSSG